MSKKYLYCGILHKGMEHLNINRILQSEGSIAGFPGKIELPENIPVAA